MTQAASGSKLFTIGHSNMSFEAFASILKQFAINTIVDIRRFPSSQKFPHFNRKALQGALGELGIAYVWLEGLGGRRNHGLENSPNVGLRVKGFRNYADHMFSSAFKQAVSELLRLARESTTVIMCAERHFWRCHRRLLSDHLFAQGTSVVHICRDGSTTEHKLSPAAFVTPDKQVIYPAVSDAAQERILFQT